MFYEYTVYILNLSVHFIFTELYRNLKKKSILLAIHIYLSNSTVTLKKL